MEGADEVVYFTHDYTSMVSCKNNSLVATSQLAKKLGVQNLVAVCPVEHDLASSEEALTWIEKRQEAEEKALSANSRMSLLNTDLVYGSDPTHLVHYMHQCAVAGKIQAPFHSESAKFQPVHHDDLTRAVATCMDSAPNGQFAVRGSTEVTSKQLLNLVEASVGKEEGATKAVSEMPLLPLARIAEEFLFGLGADTNMAEMIAHFENGDAPVTGTDFWTATGTEQEGDLHKFFAGHRVSESSESLLLPTWGGYKTNMAD